MAGVENGRQRRPRPRVDLDLALVIAAAAALALLRRRHPATAVPAWLAAGPLLPAACALLTALWLAWLFGGLDPLPVIHDEHSYLLEAALLARGQVAAAARPIPAFFEQYYVFVTPVTASRYPPGWSLALAPGVAAGLRGVIPILLTAGTAALLVAGVRRLAGAATALLAWALWLAMPSELRFRPTLLSEHLSTLLMVTGWWAILAWRADRRTGWLLLLGAVTAWLGITRPLTAVAYAIGATAMVLPAIARRRAWRPALGAVAAGLPFIALLAWHDHAVTGSVFSTPLRRYSEVYFPFDLPGFGLDRTPPERALPEDFARFAAKTAPLHTSFTVERLPRILAIRLERIGVQTGRTVGTATFWIAVLAGVAAGGALARWGLAFAALHIASYLTFSHYPTWTIYYLELDPLWAALAAYGIATLVRRELPRGLVALWVAGMAIAALPKAREDRRNLEGTIPRWIARLQGIPAPAIVFVRYAPDHDPDHALIVNEPDLARAPRWVVYDRGAENAALRALAPERTAWRYDEATDSFTPLP